MRHDGAWRFNALITGSTWTASPTALIMTMQIRSSVARTAG
jgi:hypothetical protein